MATADVKALYEKTRRPVCVVGRGGKVQWSEVFDHNPKISRSRIGSQTLENGPGLRPYIASRSDFKWTWRRGRNQQPGEIVLLDREHEFGKQYRDRVLIEPNVKMTNGHANKSWPFERWQALVNEVQMPMIQVGHPGTRWLSGVTKVETPTFRMACSVLAHSKAFVGTEGALHHAASALAIPAVVLWSHFIDVDVTGYSTQMNIRHAGEPCGSRIPCQECEASMARISVDEVADALIRMAS